MVSTEVWGVRCGWSGVSWYHPHSSHISVAFVFMKDILVSRGSLSHPHHVPGGQICSSSTLCASRGWLTLLATLSPPGRFAAPPVQPPPLPCFCLCYQHYQPCPRGPGRLCLCLLTTGDHFSVAVPFSWARCPQQGCEHSRSGLPHTWGLGNCVSARNLQLSQSGTGGQDLSLT